MRGSSRQLESANHHPGDVAPRGLGRWLKAGLLGAVAVGIVAAVHPLVAAGERVEDYATMQAGEWVRGPNITTPEGEPMPRQEHAIVNLEGFIYGINGLVPVEEEVAPTADEPDPDAHEWGRATTVYVPPDHPYRDTAESEFLHLDGDALHPTAYHHLIAAAHKGRIWTFGGHAIEFEPTDEVYVFSPGEGGLPEGSWSGIRARDGGPCDPQNPQERDECLTLPEPRAAGAAVSVNEGIYLLGGVVYDEDPRDPVNGVIRADTSVYFLDTTEYPLAWQRMPSMEHAREHFSAELIGDRIYAMRGRTADDTKMRSVESWAPGEEQWRQEQDAPIGGSAGVVASIDQCIYVFGGEFTPMTMTGTLRASQVFHAPTGTWQLLQSQIADEPDASDALALHGVFGEVFTTKASPHIFVFGGGDEAWGAPISKTHIFTPPASCAPPEAATNTP
jgi:hypothetical protein